MIYPESHGQGRLFMRIEENSCLREIERFERKPWLCHGNMAASCRFLPQILGTNSDPSMMIEIPNLTSAKSVVGFPFPLHNMFSLVVTIHIKNTPEKRGLHMSLLYNLIVLRCKIYGYTYANLCTSYIYSMHLCRSMLVLSMYDVGDAMMNHPYFDGLYHLYTTY